MVLAAAQIQPRIQPEPNARQADPKLHFASADKIQRIGIRILLLGMTPEGFVGNNRTRVVLIWAVLAFFHTGFATYEAVITLFFTRNLLERVSHGYITTYLYAFNIQWFYMLLIIPKLHSSPIRAEDFHCTKFRPESAQKITDRNFKSLTKVLICPIIWWFTNSMTHLIGPVIEAIVSYTQDGQVNEVSILPQVFKLPIWGQILMYFANAITNFGLVAYCAPTYAVMGVQVTKIKILCEILNEALASPSGNCNICRCIEDHVEIIKRAKELNHQLSTLNGFMFTSCYLEIATQLFVMTLFDPNGAYYLAVAFDLLSVFLILVLQCFMGSQINHSLGSIAEGSYDSEWYKGDKTKSRYVQMMIQMAQKEFQQTIWFGALKVERATTLRLLRSSYAAYTVLMIFQNE